MNSSKMEFLNRDLMIIDHEKNRLEMTFLIDSFIINLYFYDMPYLFELNANSFSTSFLIKKSHTLEIGLGGIKVRFRESSAKLRGTSVRFLWWRRRFAVVLPRLFKGYTSEIKK